MTKAASRQLVWLTGLAVIVVVVVVARRSDTPAARVATSSNPAQGTTASGTKAELVADVRLELLKSSPADLQPSARNPFQFRSRALPTPPPPSAARGRGAPVVVGPPSPPPGPPPLPPIALKYIGVIDTARGKVAMFKESGGDVLNGKEGDIIDGRYRLLKIGVESVDLAYADGRGRQTIRLSGQ